MATINEHGETVIELKCVCGEKVGTLTFPPGVLVNEDKILAEHESRCDNHKR